MFVARTPYTHYACRPHLRLATFHFISTLSCAARFLVLGSHFCSFPFNVHIFSFMCCVFSSASKQIGSYGVYSVFITNYYGAVYDFSIWLIFRIASHSCKTCMTICLNSAQFYFFRLVRFGSICVVLCVHFWFFICFCLLILFPFHLQTNVQPMALL